MPTDCQHHIDVLSKAESLLGLHVDGFPNDLSLQLCGSKYITTGSYANRVLLIELDNVAYAIALHEDALDNFLLVNHCSCCDRISKTVVRLRKTMEQIVSRWKAICLISLAKPSVYQYPRFPLAVSVIASAIRDTYCATVDIFDLQLDEHEKKAYAKISTGCYDVIGLSMTFGLYDVMERILEAIRLCNTQASIVIGGSLAALMPDKICNQFHEAIVSLSEGERFFPDFIRYLHGEIPFDDICDVAFFDSSMNKVCLTKKSKNRLKRIQYPELDLYQSIKNARGAFQIETSRGCFNECSFCPRQHKAYWRASNHRVADLENFIDYFEKVSGKDRNGEAAPVMHIVDEEFIGPPTGHNRKQAEAMTNVLDRHRLPFEISLRMENVYSQDDNLRNNIDRIKTLQHFRDCGLRRILIGVESGVDSILQRFNKRTTANENTVGVRLLTGSGIPVRFTYILFDPLMTFEELELSYQYIGRKDLVLKPLSVSPKCLLEIATKETISEELFSDYPFYHEIPYMLTSLECLCGSKYNVLAQSKGLEAGRYNYSLGKQDYYYRDSRIGLISLASQYWIDRSFSLDYSLKSISKIYKDDLAVIIRQFRNVYKDASYCLLGRLISETKGSHSVAEVPVWDIMNEQFNLLREAVESRFSEIRGCLERPDQEKLVRQIAQWADSEGWELINE